MNERVCGNCKLCCKVFAVYEIDKPAGKWCLHCPAKGCKIYDSRPQSCREFGCLWIAGALPENCRPDKLHVVFAPKELGEMMIMTIVESHHGAANDPTVNQVIESLRLRGLGIEIIFNGMCHHILEPLGMSDLESAAFIRYVLLAEGGSDLAEVILPTKHDVLQGWDEDRTEREQHLYLDAASYKADRLFGDSPQPSRRRDPSYVLSPQGSFAYINALLPQGQMLMLYGGQRGLVYWNGDVVLPMLVDMTINSKGTPFPDEAPEMVRAAYGNVWMSLTPAEMLTQRSGIQKAAGKVVIGGLGLGWFLRKVCEKDSVDQVIVVEKSRELLDWYGYDLCKRYPKVTDVICNDIYAELGRHGESQFLLDIWPVYAGASYDPQYHAAKKTLGDRLWAWGID